MLGNGEAKKEAIRPDFNKSIFIDFSGAKITSDAGFLLMREVGTEPGGWSPRSNGILVNCFPGTISS